MPLGAMTKSEAWAQRRLRSNNIVPHFIACARHLHAHSLRSRVALPRTLGSMVVAVGLFTGSNRVCQLSHQLGKPSLQSLQPCRLHHYRQTRARIAPAAGLDIFSQAWGTNQDIDAQSLAADLFASSIFPYAGFLYHLTRSKKAPGLTLFGFYFLLVFVAATIPAGIYAKVKYKTILANVDWLHGTAESFLTITNLFIVLGLRKAIRRAEADSASEAQQK